MENILNQIMGVSEAAERWGLDSSTVKKMCSSGKIESVKIGDTWIMRKDVERPISQSPHGKNFNWQDHLIVTDFLNVLLPYELEKLDVENCYEKVSSSIKTVLDYTKQIDRRSKRGHIKKLLLMIAEYERQVIYKNQSITNNEIREKIIDKIENYISKIV